MSDMFRKWYKNELTKSFDPYVHGITVVQENHRLIHDGFFFTTFVKESSVANGGFLDLLLEVPAGCYPHLQQVDVSLESGPNELLFYEGTTESGDGTTLSAYNKNRNSANTPQMTARHNPTISDPGTLINEGYFPTGGKKEGALSVLDGGEWVLAPETKYLIRFRNDTGQLEDLLIRIYWYELGYPT